jgi:hypothetical protein
MLEKLNPVNSLAGTVTAILPARLGETAPAQKLPHMLTVPRKRKYEVWQARK